MIAILIQVSALVYLVETPPYLLLLPIKHWYICTCCQQLRYARDRMCMSGVLYSDSVLSEPHTSELNKSTVEPRLTDTPE